MNLNILNFFPKLSKTIYSYCILAVVLPLFLLKILGFLQPLEFLSYDFFFYLNPDEAVDDRITLVEWDEKSIQTLEESIVSDRTLVFLLNQILAQKPRFIGLDLYRDLPVPSPNLNIEGNKKAFQALSDIFSDNDNIMGVQKSIPPLVAPPKILWDKELVAASDIPADRDSRIRRAYIYPTVDHQGYATQVPYIGVALGYEYLAMEGFSRLDKPGQILISDSQQEILIKPIEKNISNFLNHDPGWDFLVNWRQVKGNKSFNSISAIDLLEKPDTANLFRERLVIIGNTANSKLDIHYTPLNRWQIEDFTFGVEIVAQVASSIISAGIDNRKLINPASFWLESFLMVFSVFFICTIGQMKFEHHLPLIKLNLSIILLIVGLFLSLSWIAISFICFRQGLWLSVIPAILGILFSYILTIVYYQVQREKQNFIHLRIFLRNFNHNLSNISSLINLSKNNLEYLHNANIHELEQENEANGISSLEFYNSSLGINLIKISQDLEQIQNQTNRMNRYQEQTSNYINYTYTHEISSILHQVNFNQEISKTVNRFHAEHPFEYQVILQELYDRSIGFQNIYLTPLQIILENLLDNAYYAVNPIEKSLVSNFRPRVIIKTKNQPKFLQIIVEDNGCGIPQEKLSEVFLPSVSFRSVRSSGTGLYLISQILKTWPGTISLQSQVNQGTKITVNIPKLIHE